LSISELQPELVIAAWTFGSATCCCFGPAFNGLRPSYFSGFWGGLVGSLDLFVLWPRGTSYPAFLTLFARQIIFFLFRDGRDSPLGSPIEKFELDTGFGKPAVDLAFNSVFLTAHL